MSNRRIGERLGWLLLALAAAAGAVADEPREWLQRMNQALTTRNYDGVFTHWHSGQVETLRIIHRVRDGEVMERLVSLDGSGREFIRTGKELVCYLPDQQTVLVETRPQGGSLLGGLPTFDEESTRFYEIDEIARTRLNRRDTRVIAVKPKDGFRYGYRLWIDESSAMPLKTQLCDESGRVIEQIVFANLSFPESIPDSTFKPEVSTEGFRWVRHARSQPAPDTPVLWNAPKLPPGFRMTARSSQMKQGSREPVAHLVFTDGLASVSVFVESRQQPAEQQPIGGPVRFGASSAFSTVIDGHQVTAVGEVPPETVRFIANSLQAEPAPIQRPRGR